jgi:hypothetical protein
VALSDTEATVAQADSRALAAGLAPLLRHACDGRLGEIAWFKADWQRGGAATGVSTYRRDDGISVPVVIKLPVGSRELLWTRRLQDGADAEPVAPRLYRSGESLAGYDLAWMVIERFPHGPLGLHWHESHVERIAEALARFHAAAAAFPIDQPAKDEPWEELLRDATESVRTNHLAEEGRWAAALKALRGRLDELAREWRARPARDWLHGDAHVANAMSRHGMDEGPVCLIDLAEVHVGHWVEDAVFLERQFWARPERLKPVKPLRALADARKRLGLALDADHQRLARIRRVLLAATAPRFIRSEGHPRHLEACLGMAGDVVEGALKRRSDQATEGGVPI